MFFDRSVHGFPATRHRSAGGRSGVNLADAFRPGQLVTDEAALRLARVFSQEHPRYEPEWQVLHVDEPLLAENETFYSRLS
jgi:hypothetical protein